MLHYLQLSLFVVVIAPRGYQQHQEEAVVFLIGYAIYQCSRGRCIWLQIEAVICFWNHKISSNLIPEAFAVRLGKAQDLLEYAVLLEWAEDFLVVYNTILISSYDLIVGKTQSAPGFRALDLENPFIKRYCYTNNLKDSNHWQLYA